VYLTRNDLIAHSIPRRKRKIRGMVEQGRMRIRYFIVCPITHPVPMFSCHDTDFTTAASC